MREEKGMENKMFCFQCEQTAGGIGCTGGAGVCGKKADTAQLQDELTGALIMLAYQAKEKNVKNQTINHLILQTLFTTLTNVNFNNETITYLKEEIHQETIKIGGIIQDYDMKKIWNAEEDIRSLKSLILFGIRGVAAYAYHADVLGYQDTVVTDFLYKALAALQEEWGLEELLPIVMETGAINIICMELLDKANTETFGHPVPTEVSLTVEKGPFIVITGHDLYDLKLLLEQTEGKGINIYTHGEMLPAHAYPELKKYAHLKGNIGTSWQNQQKEFDNLPAPIVYTTNCLMPPKNSYSDRIYTTEVVSYPNVIHITAETGTGKKDFTPVIAKALELGGYTEEQNFVGMNNGNKVTTGFAHNAVLSVADKVVDAVKTGAIKHFFLVAGCDGTNEKRNYYRDFVAATPQNTVILTLACGKYRFNDLDLGTINGLPRLMDIGQCNDAYSALKIALELAKVFNCSVNELPLSMVLSWYEQKAVSILLSLLYLGIKNIKLGPTLPTFISPNVLNVLVENYNIAPITTVEADMQELLRV